MEEGTCHDSVRELSAFCKQLVTVHTTRAASSSSISGAGIIGSKGILRLRRRNERAASLRMTIQKNVTCRRRGGRVRLPCPCRDRGQSCLCTRRDGGSRPTLC